MVFIACFTGWCFGTFFTFPYTVLGTIIPFDIIWLIFFRGVETHQPGMFQGWKSTSLKPWWRRDVESTKQRSEVRPHFLIRHGMSFQSWGQRRSVQIFMFMIFHNNLDVYHHIWDYDISYDIFLKKKLSHEYYDIHQYYYPMNIPAHFSSLQFRRTSIPWYPNSMDLWSASFPLWEKLVYWW